MAAVVIIPDQQIIQWSTKPFPSDVLKWMKANASPKMALNLMQVCKFFKHKKFPYFVIKNFKCYGNEWSYGPRYKSGTVFKTLKNNLWIQQKLELKGQIQNLPLLLTKILYCDIEELKLSEQILSFAEFKHLCFANKIKTFTIKNTKIIDEHGNSVTMNKMLRHLPNVKYIFISPDAPAMNGEENCICAKLETLGFSNIPKNYNFEGFVSFMKNHQHVKYEFSISRESYHFTSVKKSLDDLRFSWYPASSKPDFYFYD